VLTLRQLDLSDELLPENLEVFFLFNLWGFLGDGLR
jgi:hypothetical protein